MELELLDEMERVLYQMLDLARRSASDQCGDEERKVLQEQLNVLKKALNTLADRVEMLDAEEIPERYEGPESSDEPTMYA